MRERLAISALLMDTIDHLTLFTHHTKKSYSPKCKKDLASSLY